MPPAKKGEIMTKADIMGLSVDIVELEELYGELKQYLQNEYLNVIFFVTMQMIEKSAVDVQYKELLESSDYLLPGEELVLTAYLSEERKQLDIFKNYQCFSKLSKWLDAEEGHIVRNVYYIGKTRKETQQLVDYSSEKYPWLKAQGMYCEGMEERDDLLVNEINAVAPDILIIALESPFQEEWVLKNSTKLNARLCIGIGSILEELLGEEEKKTGIAWLAKKWKLFTKKIHFNLFQKKVEKYKEKQQGKL